MLDFVNFKNGGTCIHRRILDVKKLSNFLMAKPTDTSACLRKSIKCHSCACTYVVHSMAARMLCFSYIFTLLFSKKAMPKDVQQKP